MKCIEKLFGNVERLKDNNFIGKYEQTIGNHKIKYISSVNVIKYYYHNNCICVIDLYMKDFIIDYCGYFGYSSTTRIMNELLRKLTNKGYNLLYVRK